MTQYVLMNANNTVVNTVFHGPQRSQIGYAEIADTDQRYLDFVRKQAALAAYGLKFAEGVKITCISAPTVNGNYNLDPASMASLMAEMVSINTTGKFTTGGNTRLWRDLSGSVRTFPSPTMFLLFAQAVNQYAESLALAYQVVQDGGDWLSPSSPATLP